MEIIKTVNAQGLGAGDYVASLSDLDKIFENILAVALGFAGIALFVMFLLGGFNLLTAGSDPGKAEAAKKTLTYAVFGLVAIAAAYLVLRLIAEFTGAKGILEFNIIYKNNKLN